MVRDKIVKHIVRHQEAHIMFIDMVGFVVAMVESHGIYAIVFGACAVGAGVHVAVKIIIRRIG